MFADRSCGGRRFHAFHYIRRVINVDTNWSRLLVASSLDSVESDPTSLDRAL
jgi:hypothetical protein